jgi:hypothetical protein
MYPTFGTEYDGFSYAKREDVMLGGIVPWTIDDSSYCVKTFRLEQKIIIIE